MKKIRVYNPCNQHTKDNRFYNTFWDEFTEYLKQFFIVEENRFFVDAHVGQIPLKLPGFISDNFQLLECEYLIQNAENNEFVLMSVSDTITEALINERKNPLFKRALFAQFYATEKSELFYYVKDEKYKYSPWVYFPQSAKYDLERFYKIRQESIPIKTELYFRGTSLDDRTILNHIDKNIITPFEPISSDQYFNDIIRHKIALSVDGRGEFCYRDIECFAIGVPIIRFEYESKLYNDLIPNYHYISIPRPNDMELYRTGNENHAKILEQRYYEVINDDSFLSFVSKNARQYYLNYCVMDKIKQQTFHLLHLDLWL